MTFLEGFFGLGELESPEEKLVVWLQPNTNQVHIAWEESSVQNGGLAHRKEIIALRGCCIGQDAMPSMMNQHYEERADLRLIGTALP